MIKALAVVCVRNEVIHIKRCLKHLIESGLDVYLIDNDSTDGTRDIASDFLGQGLVGMERLPWNSAYSLTDQLHAKQRVYKDADHDWVLHADADEWLCSPIQGQSLLEGFDEADAAGYNCVNFHEAVFVPLQGEDFYSEDYAARMSNYYFFQPSYPRLNRAWNRRAMLSNAGSGGHLLQGNGLRRSPIDFILRHYIVLSEAHACAKYVGREFSDEDREKGWHGNRIGITRESLRVKPVPELKKIHEIAKHHLLDFSRPVTKHFWEW